MFLCMALMLQMAEPVALAAPAPHQSRGRLLARKSKRKGGYDDFGVVLSASGAVALVGMEPEAEPIDEEVQGVDPDRGGSVLGGCVGLRVAATLPRPGTFPLALGLAYRRSLTRFAGPMRAVLGEDRLVKAYTADRADYQVHGNELALSVLKPLGGEGRHPLLVQIGAEFGYVWGRLDTTRESAPMASRASPFQGMSVRGRFGVGWRLSDALMATLMGPVPGVRVIWVKQDHALPFVPNQGGTALIEVPLSLQLAVGF
jgi:hypothetical protein